jgi:hypothetical protein
MDCERHAMDALKAHFGWHLHARIVAGMATRGELERLFATYVAMRIGWVPRQPIEPPVAWICECVGLRPVKMPSFWRKPCLAS